LQVTAKSVHVVMAKSVHLSLLDYVHCKSTVYRRICAENNLERKLWNTTYIIIFSLIEKNSFWSNITYSVFHDNYELRLKAESSELTIIQLH